MDKKNSFQKLFKIMTVVLFLGWALCLRWRGLGENNTFWVDEASTARFARAIIERGTPTLGNYTDWRYATHYYLTALSMKALGLNEYAARFPSVFLGTLTVLTAFWLGKMVGGYWLGLAALVFNGFSILEITWSRQARGYALLQLLYLLNLSLLFAWKKYAVGRKKIILILLYLGSLILAILTHPLGWLLTVNSIWFLYSSRQTLLRRLGKRRLVFLVILTVSAALFWLFRTGIIQHLPDYFLETNPSLGLKNNIRYYHSFFWRQYGLIFLPALGGLAVGLRKNKLLFKPILILSTSSLVFISFFFQPFTRYPFVVMPLLFLSAAYFFESITTKKYGPFLIALFIVINGSKFTALGEAYYSLNADMKEVPEPDFKTASLIAGELAKAHGASVIITTHPDPVEWYLGEGTTDYLLTQRPWFLNNCQLFGNAYGDQSAEIKKIDCVSSVARLERLASAEQRGLIIMDRTVLSDIDASLTGWIEEKMKREYRSERILPDKENDWPIEVYSWGMEDD